MGKRCHDKTGVQPWLPSTPLHPRSACTLALSFCLCPRRACLPAHPCSGRIPELSSFPKVMLKLFRTFLGETMFDVFDEDPTPIYQVRGAGEADRNRMCVCERLQGADGACRVCSGRS